MSTLVHKRLPPGHFFGTSVSSWGVGGFLLSESVYAPRTALIPHAHPRAYLCLVVRGGHRETSGVRERDCTPATVVFHPAGERHANEFGAAGAQLFRLELEDEWLIRLRESGAQCNARAECHRGLLSRIAFRMFAEFRARDSMSPLMIEALALEFAAQVGRSREALTTARAPEWLAGVVDFLHAHATEEIRLDDLARIAGVHPAHLNRVFRARHGYSIGEYTRRLRVDLAARALADSQRPIADIATATGFADQSHFSRVFVRLTGLTPGRYRKLHASL